MNSQLGKLQEGPLKPAFFGNRGYYLFITIGANGGESGASGLGRPHLVK